MDIATIYSARTRPRPDLDSSITDIISRLKISFKPSFRRPFPPKKRHDREETTNWRENVLVDVVRKVREKDDADYDAVSAILNKISKQSYQKLVSELVEFLGKRDALFRLRVTTLLFDRGIRQNFYAPIMADVYGEIIKLHPDASGDLMTQIQMFDTLYDTGNVTVLPASSDPAFNDAIIAWTKQKEMKRGFAVYLAELYSRELVSQDTMLGIVRIVLSDLLTSMKSPKTSAVEEHVDALARFLFAVSKKVPIRKELSEILALPRPECPALNMKSRFCLEDAAKASSG
jgi:hypothetical protein